LMHWLSCESWWIEEPPNVPRTTDKRLHRASRLKCIGNGQVPHCAESALRITTPPILPLETFR
jgi:hypothetical protein